MTRRLGKSLHNGDRHFDLEVNWPDDSDLLNDFLLDFLGLLKLDDMEPKGVSVDGVAVHVGVSGEGNIGRGGVAGVLMFINTTFMVLVDLFESELLNDGADTL